MRCNICGCDMEQLDILPNHEVEVTKVYNIPNYSKAIDIPFYRCNQCSHGQIQVCFSEDYYKNYELIHNVDNTGITGSYTKTLLQYYEEKFQELAGYISHNNKVLDIGCGPGILLKMVSKYFQKGVGGRTF